MHAKRPKSTGLNVMSPQTSSITRKGNFDKLVPHFLGQVTGAESRLERGLDNRSWTEGNNDFCREQEEYFGEWLVRFFTLCTSSLKYVVP